MLASLMRGMRDLVLTRPQSGRPAHDDEQARFFEENGYLILPGFFSPETVRKVKAYLDELWTRRAERAETVIDTYFSLPNASRQRFRATRIEARASPYKILDLDLEDEIIRDICIDPRLVTVLQGLLGARPLVCNTLLFERGSQQEPHFDTFFMPSKTRNKMCASWVAFDDVTDESGPLYYYPKSHLIEPYRFSNGQINAIFSELATGAKSHIESIIGEHGLQRAVFKPKAGDVLIWHAQLLHGGSAIRDPQSTRCSLVTHYWTELDYPDASQRIDCGNGRWLLRRPRQNVVDEESMAEVDAFLATIEPPSAELLAAVPPSFDPRRYLVRNQDVMRGGESPWRHYVVHGAREGRVW